MRILFLGDIFGRSGRDVVKKYLPLLKQKLLPDVVIANIENAAHGFGITPKIADDLFSLGIDVMTSGNHIWDQKDIMPYAEKKEHFLRPYNYPLKTPGKGLTIFKTPMGKSILVINLMGRTFMDPLDDPFQSIDYILQMHGLLRNNIGAIFVDFHAEATSEKMAMAHYLDGKISCIIGTHTHAPTADAQILDNGTAIQTDAGMCGDYNSVIGVKPASPVFKFTRKLPSEKFTPTEGDGTLCGVFIETDNQSGLAKKINPIRLGPRLIETPLDF
ncbi:MAG: 2',3'-cyclic-nucleotide 2'-phosphodiesterase [Holosporales bacterium]